MTLNNDINENKNKQKRVITILGSTGSIGIQTLDVLNSLHNEFKIAFLTVNKNIDLLEEQAMLFNPIGVAIRDEDAYYKFKDNTSFKGKILCGEEGIIEAACFEENDLVLSALVGFSGVVPTLNAIKHKKNIALANKETLVSAGSIITKAAKANKVELLAVDSEHSAVLQSIVGESKNSIEKIILTASGGPFRNTAKDQFVNLTVRQALNHPNWSMGSKITIDSATMMNKGFEVIEAYWLFDLGLDKIDVLIHPQSIIHSLVQFVDGSVKAQLGLPDMRIPISYALTYPNRLKYNFPRLDLSEIGNLNFSKPDLVKFPCLGFAYESLRIGGSAPSVVNAANEVAVEAFLKEQIRFVDIAECIESALKSIQIVDDDNIEAIIETDKETRIFTDNYIKHYLTN